MLIVPMRSTTTTDGVLVTARSVEGELRSRIDALGIVHPGRLAPSKCRACPGLRGS
ncbi:hypothetical protein QP162_16315 [Sphingomonas aurantiaca]|uniref:hypothetical protein n=1 Tax=Sphingomonas aurantiaca TaxID=185949 RepID=UPI002FE41462